MLVGTSPALATISRYENDLRDLGAVSVEPDGPSRVNVTFADEFERSFASQTLRDSLDGVQMVYLGRDDSAIPAVLPSPVKQAEFAARLAAVTSFRFDDDVRPKALAFGVASEADRERISGLLAESFLGTVSRVSVEVDQGRAAGF